MVILAEKRTTMAVLQKRGKNYMGSVSDDAVYNN